MSNTDVLVLCTHLLTHVSLQLRDTFPGNCIFYEEKLSTLGNGMTSIQKANSNIQLGSKANIKCHGAAELLSDSTEIPAAVPPDYRALTSFFIILLSKAIHGNSYITFLHRQHIRRSLVFSILPRLVALKVNFDKILMCMKVRGVLFFRTLTVKSSLIWQRQLRFAVLL